MKKTNKKLTIIIILSIVFVIWTILAFYRTLSRNQNWFEHVEPVVSETVVEREDIQTTNKQEFMYALAWSKMGNNWVCVNIDGLAEIVLDEKIVEVTDFFNTGYAMVKDKDGIKCIIDRTGKIRLVEYSHICENMITDDFRANMIVATKEIEVDGKKEIGYGIIDASLNWAKAPSIQNEYLKEFTRGIDGGVLTNDAGDKLYFQVLDRVIENVDEVLFCDSVVVMFRRGTEIYLVDRSGENERKSMENIDKNGEWAIDKIYCELTDGRKVFKNINGNDVLDVSNLNIVNLPRFINNYAGVLIETDEGTKYTVIDTEGKMMFEPKLGSACDTVAENYFRISYFEKGKEVLGVINEKGEIIFNPDSSITNFSNGYAIQDNEIYVRTDGTELKLYRNK